MPFFVNISQFPWYDILIKQIKIKQGILSQDTMLSHVPWTGNSPLKHAIFQNKLIDWLIGF